MLFCTCRGVCSEQTPRSRICRSKHKCRHSLLAPSKFLCWGTALSSAPPHRSQECKWGLSPQSCCRRYLTSGPRSPSSPESCSCDRQFPGHWQLPTSSTCVSLLILREKQFTKPRGEVRFNVKAQRLKENALCEEQLEINCYECDWSV